MRYSLLHLPFSSSCHIYSQNAAYFVSYGRIGRNLRFGRASSDEFWLDDVKCRGYEAGITECPHNGWGKENCGSHEAANVICGKLK